jgi:hypothetical protein
MKVRRGWLPVVLAAGAVACGGGGRGSPTCGLALAAGPTLILQALTNSRALLTDAPRGLPESLPARVVGQPQRAVRVTYEGNTPTLRYEGAHFPTDTAYAFGLLVEDDTAQRVLGVLIYPSSTVPRLNPRVGVITDGTVTLGLYGVRVNWGGVSNPRCPLLGDTAATGARSP